MSERTLIPAGVSSKLKEYHLDRQAVVYVRQSHPQQVVNHPESTQLQYALVERAEAFGWSRDRVTIIDEDQGQSAQTMAGRMGFQRLLAEVSLDHVGIILGIEMSRLARSNKDWHQLLELCAIFRTLLADPDGLYNPTDYNDRLLLGLKGTMSEAELHIMKSRMLEGKRNKARRGELLNYPPIGYVRVNDDYQFDPDEQAQSVTRLIFEVFEQEGSLHGLLRYLVAHDIQLPVRPHYGPNRGQLEWHYPNRATLQNVLHHPIYAGAYRWGHRRTDPRKQIPGRRGTGRTVNKPEDCEVLIRDRFQAYISWERFEAIQKRLEENRAAAEAQGVPREGPSLLGGLLVCGRCNRRLMPAYSGKLNRLRYVCGRGAIDYGEPQCLGVAGNFLDRFVIEQIMKVLKPASLELSLAAERDLRVERQRLEQHWRQRHERADYEVDRAARQYNTVEPENRLVVRELEARWEHSLREQQRIKEEYDRFCRDRPAELSPNQRESIMQLSKDVPGLWNADTTTPQDRQEIVRLLLEEVTINIEEESEQTDITLHWAGGFSSCHKLVRPVSRYEQLSYYQELLERIDTLRKTGHSFAKIADRLNREGYCPPKRTNHFTGTMVGRLLSGRGLHGPRPTAMADSRLLGQHEHWLTDLARQLKIPVATMHRWQRVGWVTSRKVNVAGGRWAIWADEDEIQRLQDLRRYRRRWPDPQYPTELITPKQAPKARKKT